MKKICYFSLLVLLSAFLVICCGGGGDDPAPQSTSTGATLNKKNVDGILNFVDENMPGCTLNSPTESESLAVVRAVIAISQDLSDDIRISQMTRSSSRALEQQEPLIFDGNCEGREGDVTLSYATDVDAGVMSGSIAFDNFCYEIEDQEAKIHGGLQFSGKINTDTEDLEELEGSTDPEIYLESGGDCYLIELKEAKINIEEDRFSITARQLSVVEGCGDDTTKHEVNDVSIQITEEGT